jgi:hypothetical protein
VYILVWMYWHTPVIPALRRLRQKDLKFEASLGSMERTCLKKKKKKLHVPCTKALSPKTT